ncbi:hypothetical protein [Paenibacillus bovis]|uniref:hypothetical protein n=1 Tax=Paenibacillus bovis TaxID=1616788 RepID=UPI001313E894|nr:hypothetical protein [Paenibacillus bovis]
MINLNTKGRTKKLKEIGVTTSLTIPKEFKNYITGETVPVNEQHLELLNSSTSRGEHTSLLMTGLHLLNQLNQEDETPLPVRLELATLRNDISGINIQMKTLADFILFHATRSDQH